MVLRSGIIIPFQFRDTKKLLMIGGTEENRDLSIWDLKNVVRAAFGIYNFEFRNKKIGFSIPDELLLHYLAQRHDLTNFVIEVGPTHDIGAKEPLGSELAKLRRNSNETAAPATAPTLQRIKSPNITLDPSSNEQLAPQKIRITHAEQTPEALTQSIDPMDIIPKSEQEESEIEVRETRYETLQQVLQQQHPPSHFFSNYGPGILGDCNPAPLTPQAQFSPAMMSRFRRRGERMSKDQKELYVKYFEENPCMLTQRRNDSALEPHWNKLASMLNCVPQGAVKNVEEWKQTFDAWRYRIFMYTRYNSKLTGPAAQNFKNYKPLTPTDQRAYNMWTSHKSTAPHDFEKMDIFANLDETQADYDY